MVMRSYQLNKVSQNATTGFWSWRSGKYKNRITKAVVVSLFLLPAAINIVVFRYYPLFKAVSVSTRSYSLLGGDKGSVGLSNYIQAFGDPAFLQSLLVTLNFVLIRVPSLILLGLAIALLLQSSSKTNNFLRTVVLLPTVTSIIVVSVIWTLIYNPSSGLLNSILDVFGLGPFRYLSSQENALPAVAIVTIWKDIGLSMLILLAALQNVPDEIIESAKVEGARYFQILYHVILPTIRPAILLVIVTLTVSSFQLFAPVYAMTQGGPGGTTRITVYYIYQQAFRYNDLGYANALSVLLLLVLVVISSLQFLALRTDR
jgi:ABC-type sugar transport system permease subunit